MATTRDESKSCQSDQKWKITFLLLYSLLVTFSAGVNGRHSSGSFLESSVFVESGEDIGPEQQKQRDFGPLLDEFSKPATLLNALNDTARHDKTKRRTYNFLSHYHRKTFADQLSRVLAGKLELHIEAMEPQFQSSSFYFLWYRLFDAMTEVFRPGGILKALEDLNLCIPRIRSAAIAYRLPVAVSEVRRDLTICTVDKLLNQDAKSREESLENFGKIWRALYRPLTLLLTAPNWKKINKDLTHYKPRFEQAGIGYQPPSKMSDILRDATICKIDDVFNDLYSADSQ